MCTAHGSKSNIIDSRYIENMCAMYEQVRQFYTAPTLIRSLEAQDDHFVTDHDRSSLRILGTVGEPINPRAWSWFFEASSRLCASSCRSLLFLP